MYWRGSFDQRYNVYKKENENKKFMTHKKRIQSNPDNEKNPTNKKSEKVLNEIDIMIDFLEKKYN